MYYSNNLLLQNIFLFQRFIPTILAFKEDSAGFQGTDGVPLTGGDVEDIVGAARSEFNGVRTHPLQVIVKLFNQTATEADYRF